jgi:hypothetical protein
MFSSRLCAASRRGSDPVLVAERVPAVGVAALCGVLFLEGVA